MTNVENMSFEESITALEDMVKKLENGGLDLDESLKTYEEAIALREHCKKILEDSDRKVQKIMETANGIVKENLELND
ncbi:MAG: exodeoxyribonuclease VII small subunit [Candidatus Methanogranum gryphiswaldense]|nr:MAG: exodeoxyribonuclease VII small subunit [Candidatus Methanogranum sp. U3.2.1]